MNVETERVEMTVAQTILQQLGGNKFRVMTGAKNFMEDGDSLIFWIPTKNGIDNVIITLEITDTYRMTFQKWNRKTLQQKIVHTLPVADEPYGVDATRDGTRAYVTHDYPGTVSEIDVPGHTLMVLRCRY